MIEPVEEPNSGEFVSDDEECDGNEELMAVTVLALADYSNLQTMRVTK